MPNVSWGGANSYVVGRNARFRRLTGLGVGIGSEAVASRNRKGSLQGDINVTSQWQYQIRFDVNDSAMAESIRRNLRDPALVPLLEILANHRAVPKCQFDAFAEYVAAAEAHGGESYPLYQWTKATIEDPAKKEKYLKSFTLYVDDREVYEKEVADALEADLQQLAATGVVKRIYKFDTNPDNNPQPPQRFGEHG